jgi:hypothetical protein
MSRFGCLLVLLSTAVIVVSAYFIALSANAQSSFYPGASPALIHEAQTGVANWAQGTATAQAISQHVPPALPASQIPPTCSLYGTTHQYGSYRLPWTYWGYTRYMRDVDSGLALEGVQLLACADGLRVLYWDLRTSSGKHDYYEVSDVAIAGCWFNQVRNWQARVGVHDPYLPSRYAWIEQRNRDDPFFDDVEIVGDDGSGEMNKDCTAS